MEQIYETKEQCYGCSACMSICPVSAIHMEEDEEGFLYPKVDQELCINCQQCVSVCPNIGKKLHEGCKMQKYYAVKHQNDQVRKQSSSGGVFTAISDVILRRNGVVYGAAFSEGFLIRHERAETEKKRDDFRGSKYVQSDIGRTMQYVLKDLTDGRWVLFSGTPCQVAGLKEYIMKKKVGSERLILCDFICHGTSSPGVWRKYMEYLNIENFEWGGGKSLFFSWKK